MTAATCSRCAELAVTYEIRTRGELAKAIRVVRANLDDETLAEVGGGTPLALLNEDGPWDDVIDCRFSCRTCGARFVLTAETYHGSGGRWSPA